MSVPRSEASTKFRQASVSASRLFRLHLSSAALLTAESRLRRPSIVMMQATEHGEWDDSPIATRGWRCKLLLAWDPLLNALMRSRLVEVDDILFEHPAEVGFAQNEDVIQAFAAHAPQQPFADRVRARCLDRRSQHLNPRSDRDGIEMRTVFGVVVTNQVLGCFPEGCRLAQLLGNPFVSWRPGHAHMHDPSRPEFSNHEGEQRPKQQVMDLEEVACPDFAGMVPEEGGLRLVARTGRTGLTHIPLDGPLRDLDVQLEQFALNALRAPQPVVGCHLLDQGDRLHGNLRLSCDRA